jgi:ribosomal protein L29
MTIAELRQKTITELNDLVKKTHKDAEDVSLNMLQGKEKNVKKVGALRKEIARMKTLLNEKKIAEEAK